MHGKLKSNLNEIGSFDEKFISNMTKNLEDDINNKEYSIISLIEINKDKKIIIGNSNHIRNDFENQNYISLTTLSSQIKF